MTREEAIQYIDGLRCEEDFPYTDTIADFIKERNEAIDMAIEALSAEQKEEELAKDIARRMATIIENEQDMRVILKNASAEPTDLISRADAIEELGEYFDHLKRIDKRGIKRIEPISLDCKGIINKLPSADRPSGEWIIRENGNKECSLCGHERQDGWDYFCGYCGAKMRSGGLYYTNDGQRLEWKPVSEELPQSVGSYLVTCKGEHGFVYTDYDFWTVSDEFKYNRDNVIAWVPFPKPYCCSYGERKDNIT